MEGNPYIEKVERMKYRAALDMLPDIKTKGELEFCIFYLQKLFMSDKEWKFSNIHEAVYGAIHCGDEFRRRYLDKREDEAIATNGDIMPGVRPPWEEK